jgi:hypothetical protein
VNLPLQLPGRTNSSNAKQGFATRGAGAIIVEATAVVPEGRISPEDAGLWQDSQIAPLKRIVEFVHAQTGIIGIQLAHAGRKASTHAPWVFASADQTKRAGKNLAGADENGWPDEGGPNLLFSNVMSTDITICSVWTERNPLVG